MLVKDGSEYPDKRLDVLIITPLFFRELSGAAVYYQALSRMLIKQGLKIGVVSDNETGKFPGQYYGLFPSWSGHDRKIVRDLIFYGIQNLYYFKLLNIIRATRPQVVLFHTSFFNHPGIFSLLISSAKKIFGDIRFIADVRDRLIPAGKLSILNNYHALLACSENVKRHVMQYEPNEKLVRLIPVIQEKIFVSMPTTANVKQRYSLQNRSYLLYLGGIKEEKGCNLLLESFTNYFSKEFPAVDLVLAGLLKSSSSKLLAMMNLPGVKYIGKVPRKEGLALMNGASVCINLSPNEGMPRVSLEAIALKRPVVLPPNVPEFERYCPHNVIKSTNPAFVAQELAVIYKNKLAADYPIEKHLPSSVLAQYMDLLGF